jgi:hypothetical protein
MPTTTYTPKETFFFIATPAILGAVIPEQIKSELGYAQDYTLRETAQIVREMADGNFAVSVQLCPNPLLPNKCVNGFITEQDFNKALQNYQAFGITEFLTLQEFRELEFKGNEILE